MQQSEEQQWVSRLDAILNEAESDEEIEQMLELLEQWADGQLSVPETLVGNVQGDPQAASMDRSC